MRCALPPLRGAKQTAVGIPRPERIRRVRIRCVTPRAEREAVANTVREVDALQQCFVGVGGVEIASVTFPAFVQLVRAREDREVLAREARAEVFLCSESTDAVWAAIAWAEARGDVCVRLE